MSKRKSQQLMLDHSKAKVMLLQKYLEKYLNIISNDGFTEKIYVFDLFCGERIYENEGEGSPNSILKTLKDLHFINKAKNRKMPKVDLYFNDKDEFKIEKLKNIITDKKLHYNEFGKLTCRAKDYKEIIDSLATFLMNLKKEKAFVFIDPYGYKDIRASEIKKLLQSKKSEVLLFLPTQFMYRFDEKGTPEALIQIIEEMVDLRTWKSTNSVYQFIEQFKDSLKNYLGNDFFVDTFSIEKDAATVFCLFFFSSHIRGFEKMLETKWQIDADEGKGWSYEKTGNLFSEHKTNPLEEKLVNLISKNKKTYNGEVYELTLRNGFLPTHTVEVFTSLQEKGKLEVGSDKNEKVRKGAFYINYENYKTSPNKVYFKVI
ncbi:MAG TPA: three-Cys-motif partner protein TcmP [Chitinophagaceae bacterium]|nr:three-Cys-motif partner protein TcmP [Chitinophagaceae bacterium]